MKIRLISIMLSHANQVKGFKLNTFYLNNNELRFIKNIPKYSTLTPKQIYWFNQIYKKFLNTINDYKLKDQIIKLYNED